MLRTQHICKKKKRVTPIVTDTRSIRRRYRSTLSNTPGGFETLAAGALWRKVEVANGVVLDFGRVGLFGAGSARFFQ
jgi:hypothetical protein